MCQTPWHGRTWTKLARCGGVTASDRTRPPLKTASPVVLCGAASLKLTSHEHGQAPNAEPFASPSSAGWSSIQFRAEFMFARWSADGS